MSKKRLYKAIAMLVGCTIGAGILGIPYVVAKAGLLTGLLDILAVGVLFLIIHLYLGEIALRTKGRHQLTTYAEKYLGKPGRYLMFLSMTVGIYGAIIAYIVGGGEAMANLFVVDTMTGSVVFFVILSFLVYMGLEIIEDSEALIFPIVICLIALIFLFAVFKLRPENLSTFSVTSIFLPYGVLLFAFIGTTAIPEMKEELEREKKTLKKAIIIGSLIPIGVYALFTLAVVGVMGSSTNEVASVGISSIMGEKFAFIGSLLALLTMSTSFLALGLGLKELFWYDYGLKQNTSWVLACIVPFLLFVLLRQSNLASFSRVIDVTGIITGILTCILIILMVLKAKKHSERKPEYTMPINNLAAIALIIILILGGLVKLLF